MKNLALSLLLSISMLACSQNMPSDKKREYLDRVRANDIKKREADGFFNTLKLLDAVGEIIGESDE